MAEPERRDYSPIEGEITEPEKRRGRRLWLTALTTTWVFWLYALGLAVVILLVIYLTGGFGEGAD